MAQSLSVLFTNTISHSCCQGELSPRQRLVVKPQKKTGWKESNFGLLLERPKEEITQNRGVWRVWIPLSSHLIHCTTKVKETQRQIWWMGLIWTKREKGHLFCAIQSYSGATEDLSSLCQIHSWALNLAANVKQSSMLWKQRWDLLYPQTPPPLARFHRCPSTPQTNLSSSQICCRELTEALRYRRGKITHQLENH